VEVVSTLIDSTYSCRIFCLVLTIFYVLNLITTHYSLDLEHIFGVTPGYLIPPNFWIWTLVSHAFVETTLFFLITGYTVILGSSRLLEPLWGQLEYGIFFGVVNVISGVMAAVVFLVLYVATFNISYLFNVRVHGLAAFKGGVFVALKQTRGEDTVFFKVKIKQIPVLYLCVATLLCATGFISFKYLVMLYSGVFSAWVYLRFFQRHSRGRGDLAEHFSFASFFPKVLRGPIGFFSNALFNILVKFRICQKTTYRYDVAAPSNITISLPGTSEADAERRRKKALAVLNQRLQSVETNDEEAWPTEEEEKTETHAETSDAPPEKVEVTDEVATSS